VLEDGIEDPAVGPARAGRRGVPLVTTVDAILGGPIFDGLVYRIAPGA
jgi:hypothetical protein